MAIGYDRQRLTTKLHQVRLTHAQYGGKDEWKNDRRNDRGPYGSLLAGISRNQSTEAPENERACLRS